nr:MAG TPA: hypothetical protein [Caudoviricetes sp.]
MIAKVIKFGSQKNVRRYKADITNSEPYNFWMTFIVTHLLYPYFTTCEYVFPYIP